jgi:hypothetical protein
MPGENRKGTVTVSVVTQYALEPHRPLYYQAPHPSTLLSRSDGTHTTCISNSTASMISVLFALRCSCANFYKSIKLVKTTEIVTVRVQQRHASAVFHRSGFLSNISFTLTTKYHAIKFTNYSSIPLRVVS